MTTALSLDKMSIEEKIQTMENIWDDLCKKADGILSPQWHEKVLQERESGINDGKEVFIDWKDAKKKIENSLK
ncbi:MAG: addiction module protein [Smithella sp.]